MQDVKSVIRGFILDNFVMDGRSAVGDDTSFMESHLLDSTGFIELVSFVEETFGVKVADEELLPENFDSVRNIEGFLARRGALRRD